MLLGGSVMQTEMHGSFTEHRGSRLAPLSVRVGGDNGEEGRAPLFCLFWILRCFCVTLSVLFCECNAASLAVLTLVSPLFPPTSPNRILDPKESELAAVGSRRMLFPNCGGMPGSEEMPSSRGPPGVTDLGLGLQSLRLSGWDRPWSSQDTDSHTPPSQLQSSSPSSKYQSI